jgi:hypothetical protein
VAFILGSKSSANISRHESFKQTPDLQTLLAYEMLFQTPVRKLFSSTHQEVEQKLKHRIRLLIRKLARAGQTRRIAKKIELLSAFLGSRNGFGALCLARTMDFVSEPFTAIS